LTNAKTHLSRAERMENMLRAQLSPLDFTLEDESHRHAGHAGAQPGGETHYRARVVSHAFEGLSRVARQRLVYDAVREEFAAGLHALSLELKTPGEVGPASPFLDVNPHP
jgi:BolA family transcriptional regulator, general stress-responsive regulator